MANQVFPTKGNLMATKKSLELAYLGYDLMDKKRNVLIKEMMSLCRTKKWSKIFLLIYINIYAITWFFGGELKIPLLEFEFKQRLCLYFYSDG